MLCVMELSANQTVALETCSTLQSKSFSAASQPRNASNNVTGSIGLCFEIGGD